MPLVSFQNLMAHAERHCYAVGYFESWNLESLLAVADAAERQRSPVIVGFSGIYLPHPDRQVHDRLASYAAMAVEVCNALSAPACLLFNESPNLEWVNAAIDLHFNLVMFSDENLSFDDRVRLIRDLVKRAHQQGTAVEAEMESLDGVGGDLSDQQSRAPQLLTDLSAAREFVAATQVDALAVNVGQVHVHGRREVRLDLDRLKQLNDLPVPLVLHGATSVARGDLRSAIELGVRKINVGSLLKQAYFQALRKACNSVEDYFNPYEVIGSGLEGDVLVAGRMAVQRMIEELMQLFGSAGKAYLK